MNASLRAAALLGTLLLAGCAGTPPTRYYTLDDGAAASLPRGHTPSIVLTQISLPDLIDRPQLVLRGAGNQVRVLELQRWGEAPRRGIPRVLAAELGRLLDSSAVLALPADAQRLDPDFRLVVDVLRLEAVEGQGADVDVSWRLESRQGQVHSGRTALREACADTDVSVLVDAQRRGLQRVAAEIAAAVQDIGM